MKNRPMSRSTQQQQPRPSPRPLSRYRELAYALTKWENHRLESAFVNNLVARLFIFRFVNSYS